MGADPLIVTLELEAFAFDWFEDLRRRLFPADRNLVPAHLTLFHALPGEAVKTVSAALARAADRPAPRLEVRGPWSLGRGVAYRIVSDELGAVRGTLAAEFAPWLTRQDQAPFRPHVTVQNKADPKAARALLADLQHDFEPFEFEGAALLLWAYERGPWRPLARWPFGPRG